jgi:hypothetical protein
MKALPKTLKKKWFDMIASGEKKEEYLEIKPFWINRLTWHEYHKRSKFGLIRLYLNGVDVLRRDFDIISTNNGYQKNCPNIKWKHKGIRIGKGKPEWGAEAGKLYFILEIGELIK